MQIKNISSKENKLFKHLKKLYSSNQYRTLQKQTVLDGAHLIESYRLHHDAFRAVFFSDEKILEQIFHDHHNYNYDFYHLSDTLLKSISGQKSSTGIMTIIDIPIKENVENPRLTLLLDDIQDPGNLGSILRSAQAFFVDQIFMSKGCADLWSPKTLRGSQGAQFSLQCFEDQDLKKIISKSNFEAYAISLGGESIYKSNFSSKAAFVLGNEGCGIDARIESICSKKISIPMKSDVESLNVSSAASIVMFEYARQHQLI